METSPDTPQTKHRHRECVLEVIDRNLLARLFGRKGVIYAKKKENTTTQIIKQKHRYTYIHTHNYISTQARSGPKFEARWVPKPRLGVPSGSFGLASSRLGLPKPKLGVSELCLGAPPLPKGGMSPSLSGGDVKVTTPC